MYHIRNLYAFYLMPVSNLHKFYCEIVTKRLPIYYKKVSEQRLYQTQGFVSDMAEERRMACFSVEKIHKMGILNPVFYVFFMNAQ